MTDRDKPATRLFREALAHLDVLLDKPASERVSALRDLAVSQPQLHSLLASLLATEGEVAGGFMEPAARVDSDVGKAIGPDTQIGQYRIIRQIGQGGMGEVWLARRDDGLYEGEVAIKTLHPYFAGGALRERFLHEAKLLGRLEHPNIARLLDAGVSLDGIVYLVLEYVRGESIDTWCDDRNLSVDARLRLFGDVCAAIAHAHANLIVHRDIKPSNILVNDQGRIKLLDFGIGKLVESDMQSSTELTRMTGRIFTPEYAAPEQILGQAITTATDVYSLGTLLYVLLSSARPFNSANSVDLERAVLHDEPQRMSRSVIDLESAAKRSTTVKHLQRELTGDLDNVIVRSLNKSPADRYPSVLALADDLQRYLEHRPLLAKPESVANRARKFMRRHRVGVAASCLVFAALSAGIAGVVWQAQVARTEARKAMAVKNFLVGIFERNNTAHPDGAQARTTTAEELLAISSQEIRTGLQDAPEVRLELLDTMSLLYTKLEMQDEAIVLLKDKLAALRKRHDGDRLEIAEALSNLAHSQMQNSDFAAAEASASQALSMFKALGDTSSAAQGLSLNDMGQIFYYTGRHQDGRCEQFYLSAVKLFETHHPRHAERVQAMLGLTRIVNIGQRTADAHGYAKQALELVEASAVDVDGIDRATVFQTYSHSLTNLARYGEAERYLRKAVASAAEAGGEDHPFAQSARVDLSILLGDLGQREQALTLQDAAIPANEKRYGKHDVPRVNAARLLLANLLYQRGELVRAKLELAYAMPILRDGGFPRMPVVYVHQARVLTAQGQFDEAQRLLVDIEPQIAGVWGAQAPVLALVMSYKGELQLARAEFNEAAATFDSVQARWQDAPGELSSHIARASVGRVRTQIAAGEFDQAQSLATATLLQLEGAVQRPILPDYEADLHMLLGLTMLHANQAADAKTHLEKAVVMRERMDAATSPWLAEARSYLGQCLFALGNRAQAKVLLEKVMAAHSHHKQLAPYLFAPAVQLQKLMKG